MAPSYCAARDDPDSKWPNFCPSTAAAYLYCILFALTLIAHITQSIIYRKGYSWVVAMSALWQFLAYAFRIVSIKNPTKTSWYSAWFILILLAPLWINAYVYMVLGRMVYNYTKSAKILGVKAWRFGLTFVGLDIVAFIVQVIGAASASGSNKSHTAIMRGLHVYMGGVGLQQLFIIIFFGLAILFHREMNRDLPKASRPRPLTLLYVVYSALALVTVRIIFRLVEYSGGLDTGISAHEAYQYVFDSTAMLIALALFNVVHPGRIMLGKESNFPSRKDRKAVGKDHVWGRAGQNSHTTDENSQSWVNLDRVQSKGSNV
ncbi:uncharacterized protein KY384_005225 [Bacidia gigantensis]|uniref:uncharacterized protein n=1 Tax=Bacidia gigantensis TaxID=2732470 RepID=UPI001D04F2C9|nr:uncharacterized protein KY384_005225 [Bacidia gigantensis]KAG8529744.1 hypothetical protein KY384_005225 [Bacidia gigantensis]